MTALAMLLIAVFALPLLFGCLAIIAFFGASIFGIFEGAAKDIRYTAHQGIG